MITKKQKADIMTPEEKAARKEFLLECRALAKAHAARLDITFEQAIIDVARIEPTLQGIELNEIAILFGTQTSQIVKQFNFVTKKLRNPKFMGRETWGEHIDPSTKHSVIGSESMLEDENSMA